MGHENLRNTDAVGYVEVADEPLHKEVTANFKGYKRSPIVFPRFFPFHM